MIRLLLVGGLLALTVASGVLDARGFSTANRAWTGFALQPRSAAEALACFAGGVGLFVLSVPLSQALGIRSAAAQTLAWFVVTLVSVAALDGTLGTWSRLQLGVAVGVCVGTGWLLYSVHR